MFGIGFWEVVLVAVVALLVFGPEKLPEMARALGKAMGELRRSVDEVKREFSLSDAEFYGGIAPVDSDELDESVSPGTEDKPE